jgi:hypothetical protein
MEARALHFFILFNNFKIFFLNSKFILLIFVTLRTLKQSLYIIYTIH